MGMSKASSLCCLVVVLFSICFVESRDFVVGGNENSWKVPKSGDDLNKWAQKQRFQIGDYLVFKFNPSSDSVLEVNEEDYKNCQTQNPIESYKSSNAKIELKTQGPVFFISSVKDNCEKGQKVEVEVLSPNHHAGHHHGHSSPAPSPSVGALSPSSSPSGPSIFDAPAPAPANGGTSLKVGAVAGVIALAVGLAMF